MALRSRLFLFILISAVLMACETEPLEVKNVPQAESKIVISSQVSNNPFMTVVAVRSIAALNGDFREDPSILAQYTVNNAIGSLKYAGKESPLVQLTSGIYFVDSVETIVNETYHLELFDLLTNETISASTRLLAPVNFTSLVVKRRQSAIRDQPHIEFCFEDLPGKNYYMINVQRVEDADEFLELAFGNRNHTHLIADDGTEEGEICGSFTALLGDVGVGDEIIINISHIDEGYFRFLEEINNGFNGPNLISEPYNYPTNVNNGYGWFNLYFTNLWIEEFQ